MLNPTTDRVIPPGVRTDVVTFKVLVNGAEIPRTVQVLSISVSKELNRVPVARLDIVDGNAADADFEVSNQDLFVPGNEVEIQAGYSTRDNLIFKGNVVRHALRVRSGASRLLVECRDAAYRMTLQQKTRMFEEKTDSDVFSEVLADYADLTTGTLETTSVQQKHLVQHRLSDWDFMVTRAEANGLVCFADDGTLSVLKPDISTTPLTSPTFGATILELDAELDGRTQPQALTAHSWDPAGQEQLEAAAAEPTWTDNGNLSGTDVAGFAGAESEDLYHGGALSNDELQAWADAQLLRRRAAKIRGRVRFQGWQDVKPGTTLDLQGLGERMNGPVYVTGVQHEISGGNWTTDAQFGFDPTTHLEKFGHAAAPLLLPSVPGLQIGIVTQLESDPDGEQRILVKIPAFSTTAEGVWARVATLDAGNERGTFFLPEIGDEVVLGFLEGDPRHAVVLGMLHSSAHPAPLTAKDDNHLKGYTSRSAMKLTFDDDKKIVTLETPGKRRLILDDDAGTITIKDGNGNKIVLDGSGIQIESGGEFTLKTKKDLKMESGINLELKATAQLKAEGAAGAEIKTDAIATLKGSLVQIN